MRAIVLALVLSGCLGGHREEMAEEAKTLGHMDRRNELAVAVRNDVVHGDLDAVHEDAAALATALRHSPQPGEGDRAVGAVVDRLTVDRTVEDAARDVGELTAACAGCHQGRPTLPKGSGLREPGDGVRAEMARHADALDRLWSGLVTPSDADLAEAAKAFGSSSLWPPGGASQGAVALDDRVTELAGKVAAGPASERPARFADLLVTCAACHTTKPGGIQVEPD